MIKNSFLAVIPARKGSKGLHKKNIAELNDFPLIYWTITAALGSNLIQRTIISSNDPDVLSYSKEFNVDTRLRPNNISLDDSSSEDLIVDIIDNHQLGKDFEYFVLLQPTSPLRSSQHIDEAINLLIHKDADALISVTDPKDPPQKTMILDKEGFLTGLVDDEKLFFPRQKLERAFKPNGAIYIIKIKEFLLKKSFLLNRTIPYFMNEATSIDIDTNADLEVAEKIMKSQ